MSAAEPRRALLRITAGLCLVALAAPAAPARAAAPSRSAVRVRVPDLDVTNESGQTRRFLSGVIGDRLAAITFTYTSCTTICPVLEGIFQTLQKRLGERLGKEVLLITLTIDPANDIPARLKAHAQDLRARPGWTFLTGTKDNVTSILKGLEVYSPDLFNHPPTVFVVDGRRGAWNRLYGFPSASVVEGLLDELRAARAKT
ncbi:MAG: SCO family protein [Deltaproteobacteria bacterium]|nr:SCO family protein [Deltaproteobacteria bacterium]